MSFLSLALFISISFPAAACSQSDPYRDAIMEKADELGLDRERTWEVLLHYTKTRWGGYKSRIDDEKFFLAPNGRVDKKAELEATVKSFFDQAGDGEHTACRFPARYEWLRDKLELDPARLPPFTCSEKERIFREIDAKSAVLVFPIGHINSPASMFGHTLLRIDGGSKSNLVSYAANYAAITNDSNGLVYAWKGLFGLYRGYYSIYSYYQKVKEYNDLEHRDMWEYGLKLSEIEVGRMLNHIWELQNIHSPYYFFDENCSYNLLFLIESARPELHLTDRAGIFVLPTNTINLAMEAELLEPARYRPSQGTRIRKILSLLDRSQQQMALNLAMGTETPESLRGLDLPDPARIKMLDLAAEFVQFRLSREELDKTMYSRLYLKILAERSRLGGAPEGLYEPEEPATPETGHRTTKVSVGGGIRKGRPYTEIKLQPEFHALLDPDRGYLKGAQIKFLDTSLKYDFSKDELQLKYLHLIDIFSIAPRDAFFKPLSWKVNVGAEREALAGGEDHLIGRIDTGGGYAFSSPFGGIVYALGEMDVNAGGGIRAGITAGTGIGIGAVEQLTERWKIHLAARAFLYKIGDDRHSIKFYLGQNFSLGRNSSITMESSHEFVNGYSIPEGSILLNFYF